MATTTTAASTTTTRPSLHRSSAITSTPPPVTPEPNPTHQEEELTPLEQFLLQTLSKNTKDRNLMLRIEADLNQFLKDGEQSLLAFPAMSSYQRMLVHRIAGWYGLEHNLEGASVVVGKKEGAGVPGRGLRELERVGGVVGQPPSWTLSPQNPRLLKVESFNAPSPITPRPHVSKSYSFGGYQRSWSQQQSFGVGRSPFSRTPTNNSSISPASSGYKSTSFEHCITPPPQSGQQVVCWAVTDLSQVPVGVMIIEPGTGQPLRNQDGSLYYFDPARPPEVLPPQPAPTLQPLYYPPVQPVYYASPFPGQQQQQPFYGGQQYVYTPAAPVLRFPQPQPPPPHQQQYFVQQNTSRQVEK